jgi:hypothetical protein
MNAFNVSRIAQTGAVWVEKVSGSIAVQASKSGGVTDVVVWYIDDSDGCPEYTIAASISLAHGGVGLLSNEVTQMAALAIDNLDNVDSLPELVDAVCGDEIDYEEMEAIMDAA